MKKILITGVNGFVAKYFVEYLNKNDTDFNILGLGTSLNTELDIDYKQADLTDGQKIYKILEDFKPDYILHLASISSVSQSWVKPVESFVNNTNIFLNLIESVRKLNLNPRILSIGSSEEYGNYLPEKMPLKEVYELHPNNPYSVARVSQEMLSKLYADNYGLDIVMTRSFNHIGPEQKDIFVVPSFVKQLVEMAQNPCEKTLHVGNIEIIRDFLDVRDVVDAYYKLLINGQRGQVYNVCSGYGIKLKDLIEIITRILKVDVKIEIDSSKIRPSDNHIIIGDNSKIKSELNWQPQYSLEQTLEDMIEYWKHKIVPNDITLELSK